MSNSDYKDCLDIIYNNVELSVYQPEWKTEADDCPWHSWSEADNCLFESETFLGALKEQMEIIDYYDCYSFGITEEITKDNFIVIGAREDIGHLADDYTYF